MRRIIKGVKEMRRLSEKELVNTSGGYASTKNNSSLDGAKDLIQEWTDSLKWW